MSPARTASLSFAAALALALSAHAQPRESRREFDQLVRSAVQHYEAGESRAAIDDLQRAYAIRPLPRLLYNLGRAHEQAGEFGAAADYYRRFIATNPDADAAAVTQVALAEAERRQAAAAEAERQREAARHAEEERALAAERARAAEAERQRQEEQRRRSAVTLAPRRVTTPMVVLWGIAGAGAIAGGVLGGLALSAQGDWSASHQGDARASAYDRGTSMALGADIAIGAALVSGAVGLILYLVQPRPMVPAAETAP